MATTHMTRLHSALRVLLIAMLIAFARMGIADIPCPIPPEQAGKDLTVDTKVKLETLSKLGAAELSNKTEVLVKPLLDKTPNADRILIANLMLSGFCQLLNKAAIDDGQKLDRWERFSERVLKLLYPPTRQRSSEAPTWNIDDPIESITLRPEAVTQDRLRTLSTRCQEAELPFAPAILVLDTEVAFASPKFNSERYLRSVANLWVGIAERAGVDEMIEAEREGEISGPRPSLQQLRGSLCFPLARVPAPQSILQFSIGPVVGKIPIGKQKWTRLQSPNQAVSPLSPSSQIAFGRLAVKLRDPSWPILSLARILAGTSSDTSIVEVVIDNRAKAEMSLDRLSIAARWNHGGCAATAIPYVYYQHLELDWNRIMLAEANGAVTRISETPVRLVANVDEMTCNRTSFDVAVPIAHVAPAGQITRIQLLVHEMPTRHVLYDVALDPELANSDVVHYGGEPIGLGVFDVVYVGVDPAVWPSQLKAQNDLRRDRGY